MLVYSWFVGQLLIIPREPLRHWFKLYMEELMRYLTYLWNSVLELILSTLFGNLVTVFLYKSMKKNYDHFLKYDLHQFEKKPMKLVKCSRKNFGLRKCFSIIFELVILLILSKKEQEYIIYNISRNYLYRIPTVNTYPRHRDVYRMAYTVYIATYAVYRILLRIIWKIDNDHSGINNGTFT